MSYFNPIRPNHGPAMEGVWQGSLYTSRYRVPANTLGKGLMNYRSKFTKITKHRPFRKSKDTRHPVTKGGKAPFPPEKGYKGKKAPFPPEKISLKKNIYNRLTMPRRYSRRKRSYRRRRTFRKKNAIPRSVVPSARLVKLRSCDRLAMTGTSGAIAKYHLTVNSLQDPFEGNSTVQPLYYDQIKTMYRTAVVLGAKVSVSFHNTSSTVPMVAGLYIVPYDSSATIDSYEYFRESSWVGRQRIMSSDIDITFLAQKVSCRKYFKQNVKAETDFECDIENDGDPSKKARVVVWSQALDQSTTHTNDGVIVIEQVVLLKDPYTPARSTDA